MGTSASYKGPNWPASSEAVKDAASSGSPTAAKVGAAVAAFARDLGSRMPQTSGGGGSVAVGGASGRGGVGGRGGGGGGGASGRASATGARLASFLGTAQQKGLLEALEEFDLEEYRESTLEELCDALLEALTDPDGLLDDTALREAMDRTLEELTQGTTTADELETLLTGKGVNIPEVVAIYYCHVLAVNFEVKEFSRIREQMNTAQGARDFIEQAREYIRGFVEYRLSKEVDLTKYDFKGRNASEMAARLNREVIEALGADE